MSQHRESRGELLEYPCRPSRPPPSSPHAAHHSILNSRASLSSVQPRGTGCKLSSEHIPVRCPVHQIPTSTSVQHTHRRLTSEPRWRASSLRPSRCDGPVRVGQILACSSGDGDGRSDRHRPTSSARDFSDNMGPIVRVQPFGAAIDSHYLRWAEQTNGPTSIE